MGTSTFTKEMDPNYYKTFERILVVAIVEKTLIDIEVRSTTFQAFLEACDYSQIIDTWLKEVDSAIVLEICSVVLNKYAGSGPAVLLNQKSSTIFVPYAAINCNELESFLIQRFWLLLLCAEQI